MRLWKSLWQDESAQGLTEYSLILSLVAVAAVVMIAVFGDRVQTLFIQTRDVVKEAISQ